MAGKGSRFTEYRFVRSKFLLPITEKENMIQMAIKTLNIPKDSNLILVCHIDNKLPYDEYSEDYSVEQIYLSEYTDGPATTVYKAVCESTILDENAPILVSNSDQIMENWDCKRFLELSKDYDGTVLTYVPDYELKLGEKDKHSFVELDEKGKAIRFSEKIVLSNNALVGIHYFRNKTVFCNAYQEMVKRNERAPNGEFYLSLMYNSILNGCEILQKNAQCRHIPLRVENKQNIEKFYPVGEPLDYFHYLNTVSLYRPEVILTKENILFENELVSITTQNDVININVTNDLFFQYYKSERKLLCINHDRKEKGIEKGIEKEINLGEMKRGWFVGNFEPSVIRTDKFELGILKHKKGELWPFHIHKKQDEYNFLLSGKMKINEIVFNANENFLIRKGVLACPIFIEDCELLCLKFPSIPTDKIIY